MSPLQRVRSRRALVGGAAAAVVATGYVASGAVSRQDDTPAATEEGVLRCGSSADDTRMLLDRYLDALLTGNDIGEYLSPDVVFRQMDTGEEASGRDNVVSEIITLHAVQFDAQPEIINKVVGPGTAGLEVVFAGRQTGEFAGIPATGVSVSVPHAAFYTLEGAFITGIRLYGLATGLISQLSSVPATPEG